MLVGSPGARPATPRRLADRGRFTWAPDGTHLLFAKSGRLMTSRSRVVRANTVARVVHAAASEPIWSPAGTRFATLVADPSVSDPEIEPVRPGMYTIAQPFMDLYVVSADGAARNVTGGFDDQISDAVWAPDGRLAVLPGGEQRDLRRDGL